jgi:hypothetical protein
VTLSPIVTLDDVPTVKFTFGEVSGMYSVTCFEVVTPKTQINATTTTISATTLMIIFCLMFKKSLPKQY